MIDLSIIIVNYNTKDLTLDCIKSLFTSRSKTKYEIIVVDNASTDESIQAFKKLKLKTLTIITNSHNVGFAKANNQGIKIAHGKYILLLNSDTKVLSGSIDKLYNFALSYSDAGAVVPKLLNPDTTIQPSAFRFPTVWRTFNHYWLGNKLLDKYAPSKDSTLEVAVMAAFLITPIALKKVGLLNEKYFMYFEDFDYCRALNKLGLKIYFCEESKIIHIHGGSGGKNDYLIAASKKYHGLVTYFLITFIIRTSQIFAKLKHSI